MLQGSAWMTIGSIFSRILGAVYIIPWYGWFGADKLQANALYTKGYTVYSMFLMIAISGIPSAVAKQVAHYNAQNEYAVGRRLFKKSLLLMIIIGILCALLMWISAPFISQGDANLVPVYRSLAVALTVIPVMSLTRGFFQGYQDMFPSAMSQLLEQIVRIIYMLAATFFIMRVLKENYVMGVVHSTFAAFIGALGGLFILVAYYFRQKRQMDQLVLQSSNRLQVSDGHIIKEVLYESIPFIIIGVSTTLYNLIDQFTFQPVMQRFSVLNLRQINDWFALFAGNANKLIMITISLASAMAITVIPLLSEAYTKRDKEQIATQINDALELFLIVMLPCSLGMAAVAKPLYVIFYTYDHTGIFILSFASYIALPIGLFMVLSSLLQGVYQNKIAIKYFVIGLIVKMIVQIPLIIFLKGFGPLLATGIGMLVSNLLMLRFFYLHFGINAARIMRRFDGLLFFALLMFGVTLGVVQLSNLLFNPNSRIQSLIVLLLAAAIGGYVYIYLCLKTRIADKILGAKVAGLRRRLRIK
ncbi:putative polysaccharide biosynthesis protein [Liquorilactobacillus capillatus]|nr:polysaccharide biosynthesis protein [Liquorilactobacillus capillatus]